MFLVQVQGPIDLGLAPYVKRVLGQAKEEKAQAVILEISTPGGRLDAALALKDAVLGSSVRVTAFVNRDAFSAGAIIAIAAEKIYMAPGGSLGAATPVTGEGVKAREKVVSAVRTAFRSTAEARGRDPEIAEAMVDEAVVIEGLVEAEQLLTLTTKEALEWGYADGEAINLDALLETLGLADATLVETEPSWSENLVRVITNPVLASLFISLGFLGLLFEITSPGFGVAGLAGLTMLAVFFWGHFLAGLAGWEGVTLVALGLLLIGLELFFVPGFGIVGVAGLTAFMAGLFISLVGQGAGFADFQRAALVLSGAFVVMLGGGWAFLRYLPRSRLFGGLTLQTSLARGSGTGVPGRTPRVDLRSAQTGVVEPSAETGPLLGARGRAVTDLRPAGIAQIDNQRVDVVTEGGYVPAGTAIEVIFDEGYRRVVRPLRIPDGLASEQRGDTPPPV